jgi:hypothetical protein
MFHRGLIAAAWIGVSALCAAAQSNPPEPFTREFAPILGTDRTVSRTAVQSILATFLVENGGKLPCDAETEVPAASRRFITKPAEKAGGTWIEEWRVTICDRTYEQRIEVTLNHKAPVAERLMMKMTDGPRLIAR